MIMIRVNIHGDMNISSSVIMNMCRSLPCYISIFHLKNVILKIEIATWNIMKILIIELSPIQGLEGETSHLAP